MCTVLSFNRQTADSHTHLYFSAIENNTYTSISGIQWIFSKDIYAQCVRGETTYQVQMLDHNAVCLLWHFFGMKTILDWKDCKKFALKLLYTGCFFLTVPPHFLYQNEKTCSANEGFFLEKAVLVGCNLFFILVLKIGRIS